MYLKYTPEFTEFVMSDTKDLNIHSSIFLRIHLKLQFIHIAQYYIAMKYVLNSNQILFTTKILQCYLNFLLSFDTCW